MSLRRHCHGSQEGGTALPESQPPKVGQGMARLPEWEELLSLAHQAVKKLAQGLLGEKAIMDREHLLLARMWRQVQEAQAAVASEELRVAEETKRLEERHHIYARDLEARLSGAEEILQQLSSERDTARTEVLELKEGRDIALAAVARA